MRGVQSRARASYPNGLHGCFTEQAHVTSGRSSGRRDDADVAKVRVELHPAPGRSSADTDVAGCRGCQATARSSMNVQVHIARRRHVGVMQLQMFVGLEHAVAGISAAALQLAVGDILAALLGRTTSPLRAIGRWLIDLMPGPVVDVTVALLERADKAVLLGTLLALWPASAGLANLASGPGAAAAVLACIGALGVAAMLRRPELARLPAIVVATTAATTGPVAILVLQPMVVVGAAAAALLGARVLIAVRRRSDPMRAGKLPQVTTPLGEPSSGAQLPIPGISPLLTPTDKFYVTDVTFPPPLVDQNDWRLHITGLVARPLRLTLEDIVAIPSVEVDATLVCVHNPVGGHRIGTARWQGVRLAALLERVGVSSRADHVLARSVDGYSGGIPLALLDRSVEPLVVYGMNGEPLRREHGAPVRLLVPGIYGYDANVKWLQRLELTQFELARDYWERKGWPRYPAYVKTQSRIDVPGTAAVFEQGPLVIAGVAWSPPQGVTRVELSVDGAGWQVCDLADELSPAAWRQWQFRWEPSRGRHTLRVRAWSPDGVQLEGDGAPFPDGAAGYHLVTVTIVQRGSKSRDASRARTTELRRRMRLAWVGIRAWHSHTSDT